jgi:hypothetical protein
VSRKSAKHRALSRAHREAKEAGTLDEFYAQREVSRAPPNRTHVCPMTSKPSTPAPPQSPPAPQKSPEREAWERAYAATPGELGPVGGTWPEDGRHIPRMVWRLGFHELTSIPRRHYMPRVI